MPVASSSSGTRRLNSSKEARARSNDAPGENSAPSRPSEPVACAEAPLPMASRSSTVTLAPSLAR